MSETTPVSPLRQRMIEDMAARKLNPNTRRGHIQSCFFSRLARYRNPRSLLRRIIAVARHLTAPFLSVTSARARPGGGWPPIGDPRSHLINRAHYRAGFDGSAILHQDLRQNAGDRCLDLMRQVIRFDFDHGFADTDWIANAPELSPNRQLRGARNLWHFYFRLHYFAFGRSTRSSRNSDGPLVSRRSLGVGSAGK